MQIGWIDLSQEDRKDVLDILEKLGDKGVLDELGIAPIRNGFSDLFFPGTNTLQTRAKYFFIIPYICKDMEKDPTQYPNYEQELKNREQRAAKILCQQNEKEIGLIGRDYVDEKEWVVRPPSVFYWAGLRAYGIFTRDESRSNYLRTVKINKDKKLIRKYGCKLDNEDVDDLDAGREITGMSFNIPYIPEWEKSLTMKLTKNEANFLQGQMKEYSDSLLAYLLSKKEEVVLCDDFEAMIGIVKDQNLKYLCNLAKDFSDFIYIIRIIYNMIIYGEDNEMVVKKWDEVKDDYQKYAEVDLKTIYDILNIKNTKLIRFLSDAQIYIREQNTKKLQECIIKREKSLKGDKRAKTLNPKQYNKENKWYCGDKLDYRYGVVKVLINDILEGEKND